MTGPSPNAGPPSATQLTHFRHRSPPQEIQWQLERDLMELFTPVPGAPQYTLQAAMKHGNQRFFFQLRFEAALATANAYSFTATLTDPSSSPEPMAKLQQRVASWMGFWARDWLPGEPVATNDPADARYQAIVRAAQSAEAHLVSVHDLQQEILRRMRGGAFFRTVHKEGGTNIRYARGQWTREDYGDWTTAETYRDEASFLAFLRKFFHYDVSRNAAAAEISEETAWRLILRLLQEPGSGGRGPLGPSRVERYGILAWAMMVGASLIILFTRLKYWVRGRDPMPGLDALVFPAFGALGLSVVIAGVWMRRHWK